MRFLLDTHALLWWLADPDRLSDEARNAIANASNEVYVSAASAWEIAIKKCLGKLQAPNNLEGQIGAHRFTPLPIDIRHGLAAEQLPSIHCDPFDRMLVIQARLENLTIITRDKVIPEYGISVLEA